MRAWLCPKAVQPHRVLRPSPRGLDVISRRQAIGLVRAGRNPAMTHRCGTVPDSHRIPLRRQRARAYILCRCPRAALYVVFSVSLRGEFTCERPELHCFGHSRHRLPVALRRSDETEGTAGTHRRVQLRLTGNHDTPTTRRRGPAKALPRQRLTHPTAAPLGRHRQHPELRLALAGHLGQLPAGHRQADGAPQLAGPGRIIGDQEIGRLGAPGNIPERRRTVSSGPPPRPSASGTAVVSVVSEATAAKSAGSADRTRTFMGPVCVPPLTVGAAGPTCGAARSSRSPRPPPSRPFPDTARRPCAASRPRSSPGRSTPHTPAPAPPGRRSRTPGSGR